MPDRRDQAEPLGTEFTGDGYLAAAIERAGALQRLYDDGQYAIAMYAAGVAVESMFRAYRTRVNPEFSSRQNLPNLAEESKFAEHIPARAADSYSANLAIVAVRWSNSRRYRSESALLRYLNRAKLYKGIRGDVLKENTRRVVNAATDLVTLGAKQWTK